MYSCPDKSEAGLGTLYENPGQSLQISDSPSNLGHQPINTVDFAIQAHAMECGTLGTSSDSKQSCARSFFFFFLHLGIVHIEFIAKGAS